jgi:hypothetical protein
MPKQSKTGVAFVYCAYNEPHQSASHLLGSLLQQLAQQNPGSLQDIMACRADHVRQGTHPSLSEISRLLRLQVQDFDDVFLVIDALDECSEAHQTRNRFLSELRGLLPGIHLLATSRQIPSIEKSFRGNARLEICANEEDVKAYIETQFTRQDSLLFLLEDRDDVREDIVTTILGKIRGMQVNIMHFLSAFLTKA